MAIFSARPAVPKRKAAEKAVRSAANIGEMAGADTAMVRTLTQEAARRVGAGGVRPRASVKSPIEKLIGSISSGLGKLFGGSK